MNRNINAVKTETVIFFTAQNVGKTRPIDASPSGRALVAYMKDDAEEGHVQTCLATLEEGGIKYAAEDQDRRVIIKLTGLPRVEYFPAKNRWRVAGNPKKQHGTAAELVEWIKRSVR
jgi:hypothetical protein